MKLTMTAMGRLGQDAIVRTSQAGKMYVNVNVACDVGFGDKKKTQWVKLVAFNKIAEIFGRFGRKGVTIYAEGTPSAAAWTDKNTGELRSGLELIVNEFQFLTFADDDQSSSSGGYNEDIPF